MIILDSIDKRITLSTGTGTGSISWCSSWVDLDTNNSSFEPKSLNGSATGASSNVIVTSPATSHQCQVKYISIRNSGVLGESDVLFTIYYTNVSGVNSTLFSGTIIPGDTLYYTDGKGFYIINADGSIKSGTSGPSGLSGSSGSSGSSGANGLDGVFLGTSGSSGSSGSSGLSGAVGTSGSSGSTAYVGSTINTQTASYTLVLTDNGKLVEQNVATANTLTIPLNSSVAFPIGTIIDVTQYGAGIVSIVATGGVTIRSANSWLRIGSQYSIVSLIKRGTDEWYLFGDIMP